MVARLKKPSKLKSRNGRQNGPPILLAVVAASKL